MASHTQEDIAILLSLYPHASTESVVSALSVCGSAGQVEDAINAGFVTLRSDADLDGMNDDFPPAGPTPGVTDRDPWEEYSTTHTSQSQGGAGNMEPRSGGDRDLNHQVELLCSLSRGADVEVVQGLLSHRYFGDAEKFADDILGGTVAVGGALGMQELQEALRDAGESPRAIVVPPAALPTPEVIELPITPTQRVPEPGSLFYRRNGDYVRQEASGTAMDGYIDANSRVDLGAMEAAMGEQSNAVRYSNGREELRGNEGVAFAHETATDDFGLFGDDGGVIGGGGSAPPQQIEPPAYSEDDLNMLAAIMPSANQEMCRLALEATGGSLDRAAELLLSRIPRSPAPVEREGAPSQDLETAEPLAVRARIPDFGNRIENGVPSGRLFSIYDPTSEAPVAPPLPSSHETEEEAIFDPFLAVEEEPVAPSEGFRSGESGFHPLTDSLVHMFEGSDHATMSMLLQTYSSLEASEALIPDLLLSDIRGGAVAINQHGERMESEMASMVALQGKDLQEFEKEIRFYPHVDPVAAAALWESVQGNVKIFRERLRDTVGKAPAYSGGNSRVLMTAPLTLAARRAPRATVLSSATGHDGVSHHGGSVTDYSGFDATRGETYAVGSGYRVRSLGDDRVQAQRQLSSRAASVFKSLCANWTFGCIPPLLDLHGLTGDAAVQCTRDVIRWARGGGGGLLLRCPPRMEIVVGRGLGSGDKGPVLKRAVQEELRSQGIRAIPGKRGGSFIFDFPRI